jgi:tRNA(fMet)-specific endonuclease VapC
MKKIILDTNAYVRLLAGAEEILDALSAAETLYMSIFVLGELYAGFFGGNKEGRNRETLQRFLLKPAVKILQATIETAEIFGQIKNTLKRAGKPIPIHDVWIAAQSIETGSVLVTYDLHFDHVPGLRLWSNRALSKTNSRQEKR